MKKVLFVLTGVMLIATLGLAVAGCVPAGEPSTPTPTPTPSPAPPIPTVSTGTLEVRVTDAPRNDEVTSIMVTISKVEVHKAVAVQVQEQQQPQTGNQTREQQQVQEGEGEWITINISDNASTFDLLKVKGIEQFLGTSQVEAGKYTQVRLAVDNAEVALGGGEPQPATVPSGELKLVRPFDVVAGETTIVLLDFDAEKSVTVTGSDKIIVKPVVKLTVRQEGTSNSNQTNVFSQQESQDIAEEFVKNSPTFVFDGMEDTLKLADTITLGCPSCWSFTFEFQSRHAGYGDRTGQMLAQVITPHRAVIDVVQGEVTSAVMDVRWDMLTQQETGQQQAETGEQVNVDASYDGKEVKIAVGDLLIVSLESNATTGFSWELAGITDEAVLEMTGQIYEPHAAKGLLGAGGNEVWTFKALAEGESTISLEYRRPWEKDVPPAETFTLTVVVEEQATTII